MVVSGLKTVGDYMRWGEQQLLDADVFFGHGTDNAWDESVFLMLHCLKLPWDVDPVVTEQELTIEQAESFIKFIERRIDERLPAPYLTGEAWFAGFTFEVNTDVLVPRSPIAELIVEQFSPWVNKPPETILDLCTGCGCIGIACALTMEDAQVDLSDISADALTVARNNIARYQLSHRVNAIESDLFTQLADKRYDLIVSNPPYVDAIDLASMPAEYQAEPAIALGSGDDGLDFTRNLLREAANYLNDEGVLIVEVGNSGEALNAAYPSVPFLWLDFAEGGHGVFVLTKEQLMAYRQYW